VDHTEVDTEIRKNEEKYRQTRGRKADVSPAIFVRIVCTTRIVGNAER
jgi:hypothetical protein